MPLINRDIQGEWTRDFTIVRATIDENARTVEIALSSEEPYERWYGIEILSHAPGEVNLVRLQNKAAWLVDHDSRDHVGVIEKAWVDPNDRILRCLVRFGRSARASEIFQDIVDGIRTKASVGYRTSDYDLVKGVGGAPDVYRFKNWTPHEGSTVSIPADDTVGVGRALGENDLDDLLSPGMVLVPVSEPEGRALSALNPPAVPAATAKESSMPPEEIAAANKAAEDLKNSIPGLLTGERREALQIQAIAEKLGLGREAAEILATDKPLAEARAQIMALVAERGAKPLPGPGVDMSKKEAKEYSYARAIFNAVQRLEGSNIGNCFEDEVNETIQKNLPKGYKSKGGIFVPFQTRVALDTVTATAGAELKYTQFGGELIELLRNYAAVIKMGAKVIPGLSGPVSFPKLTGDATVVWVAEDSTTDIDASVPSFGSVTLSAKIMQGAVPFHRSLLSQSAIAIEPIVRETLAQGHALAIDKAALHGLGTSNQPAGIYRTSGINTKAFGGVPTYDLLVDMETEVAIDNALLNSLGWLTTPGMRGKLKKTLVASSAGSEHIWSGGIEGEINGYKAIATNQVSALMNGLVDAGGTSHGIIFGNWADLLIGFWGALELVVDPYTLKKQGKIEVASFQMGDVETRHAQSFCVGTGATLT